MKDRPSTSVTLSRIVIAAVLSQIVFYTQTLKGIFQVPVSNILKGAIVVETMVDVTHVYLEPVTIWVSQNEFVANFCTAFTTLLVDYSICYLLVVGIFLSKSWRTLATLFGVLLFRQFCQFLVYFPIPIGIIWKDPGFPSFAVDYQIVTDFFYSGHTSLIVTATLVVTNDM
jgi:hypothetical protein